MKAKKTDKRTLKKHLAEQDAAIAEWQADGKRWAKAGDRGMAKMIARDVEDLKSLRDAYAAGDFETCRRIARRVDTIVRDAIDAGIYKTIHAEL